VRFDIGKAKASEPREGFIPNPKPKLLDQVSEVMRFKHYFAVREGKRFKDRVAVLPESLKAPLAEHLKGFSRRLFQDRPALRGGGRGPIGWTDAGTFA
jgi:hypothetical protein